MTQGITANIPETFWNQFHLVAVLNVIKKYTVTRTCTLTAATTVRVLSRKKTLGGGGGEECMARRPAQNIWECGPSALFQFVHIKRVHVVHATRYNAAEIICNDDTCNNN